MSRGKAHFMRAALVERAEARRQCHLANARKAQTEIMAATPETPTFYDWADVHDEQREAGHWNRVKRMVRAWPTETLSLTEWELIQSRARARMERDRTAQVLTIA